MSGTSRHDYERYYDPPLAAIGVPGVFRPRVWVRVLLALFPGAAGAITLVAGLFCLSGWDSPGMSRAEFRTAGIVFAALGLFLGAAALLFGVSAVARRGPAVRAFREGLEVRLVGPSKAIELPSAPGPARLAWALLSGQPCRLPTARLAWNTVSEVSARGGSFWRGRALIFTWRPEPAGTTVYYVILPQSEIADPVGKAAEALSSWVVDENARASLPDWGSPA